MKSNTLLLDKITSYIVKKKGKQLRPLMVFLTSKLHNNINESSFTAASLIELLHTATLVHDDVVDDANQRRGLFSINALWKNKIAVLVGDYLLSRGLLIAVENKEFKLLEEVSNTVREMSEGELLQIEKSRTLDITEDVYFKIIKQKTASLFASCCACGAIASKGSEDQITKMRLFGEYLGMVFQIKDDLLDYGFGANIGKPTGADFKEKKMTLPLIYSLNNCSKATKKRLINTIKNHNTDKGKIAEAINIVTDTGGIDYANTQMNLFKDKALDQLIDYENSEAKQSLTALVSFASNRNI